MAGGQLSAVVQYLRKVVGVPGEPLTDAALLERFVAGRDGDAFAGLVKRHGPMVLGVCRQVLRDAHDAEDAFQATFLVLARKAGAVGRPELLGHWLYRVAARVAVRARALSLRRRAVEKLGADREANPAALAVHDPPADDLGPLLHEEVNRLPAKYRVPVLLCYLQGKTKREAARQLGWPEGTVSTRLARARELLRKRLARRGLIVTAGALTTLFAEAIATAAVPTALVGSMAKVAVLLASGKTAVAGAVSAQAALLSEGVLTAMFVAKVKIVAVTLLTVGVAGTGAATLAYQRYGPGFGPNEVVAATEPRTAKLPERTRLAAPAVAQQGSVLRTGQVLGPDGKPLTGTQVAVLVFSQQRKAAGDGVVSDEFKEVGRATTDEGGRFRLTTAALSTGEVHPLRVVAAKPGYGFSWQTHSPDAKKTESLIRLTKERILRGRLIDLQGQPAASLKAQVAYVQSREVVRIPAGASPSGLGLLTTDREGRFTLRGLAPGQEAVVEVRDERFSPQQLWIKPAPKGGPEETVLTLEPPRILTGRVTYADTGKPVPGARLLATTGIGHQVIRADREGSFRLPLETFTANQVYAYPPDGEPYLVRKSVVSEWPKGKTSHRLDLTLPRGVLVRGKVTEQASGKPVGGASVQFFPQQENNETLPKDIAAVGKDAVLSGPDGAFQICVAPGPAHLLVTAPTRDYLYQSLVYSQLHAGKRRYGGIYAGLEANQYSGGTRVYVHGFAAIDLKPEAKAEEVNIALRRGVTIAGRLLGPDGQPVAAAKMLSALNVDDFEHIVHDATSVHDGVFELHGCDPAETYPVAFFDEKRRLGVTVTLSAKQPGPVTVRLVPCGEAVLRFVGADGKPLANGSPEWVEAVVSPGGTKLGVKRPAADAIPLFNVDGLYYPPRRYPKTDAQGVLTLPALIPGLTYRIVNRVDKPTDVQVESGKTVRVPDVVDPHYFDRRD